MTTTFDAMSCRLCDQDLVLVDQPKISDGCFVVSRLVRLSGVGLQAFFLLRQFLFGVTLNRAQRLIVHVLVHQFAHALATRAL
ncbi:unannotated protein [freshwater metagenome]|uniref:Unannotated protein n=1 Tax=freshwater metagenome TaxID=449393 RepID=A0A6J6V0W1_9ZZZZ